MLQEFQRRVFSSNFPRGNSQLAWKCPLGPQVPGERVGTEVLNSVWAKDVSSLFLGFTGSNFPLGTSHCVSSNNLTGAALKSFRDSCQPKLFQGSLNSCTCPVPQQIGAVPVLQGKGFSRCPSKSSELLHGPSSHPRLNVVV